MFFQKLRVPIRLKIFYQISKLFNLKKNTSFKEDIPKDVREGEEIDLEKLKKYLSEINFTENDLSISQFPSGYSNLTYLLKAGEKDFILRRPPFLSLIHI